MARLTVSSLLKQFFVFWAALVLIIVFFTDFKLPESVAISDYLMTFHTAGWIAGHGLWASLYPPAGATTFAGAPFDKLAHQLLPLMPASSVAEYMYMPISAYIFTPFSLLQPTFSLFAWQIASLLGTGLAAYLIFNSEPHGKPLGRAALAVCATLTFFPAVFTIWIGQVGMIFGLLPLCLGYYLLRRGWEFPAGLAFALLFFKPQMLIPAFFMLAAQLGQKRWLSSVGLIFGIIALAQSNAAILGLELFESWLKCVQLSDKIYSDPAHGVAIHLATSMPRAILLSQPVSMHSQLKPVLYGAAFLLLLLGLGASIKFSLIKELKSETRLNLAFILGCLALPVVVPHLFLYDLGVLSALGFLLWGYSGQALAGVDALAWQLRKLTGALWLAITVYCSFMLTNQHLTSPVLLVAIFTLLYLLAVLKVLTARPIGQLTD